MQYSLMHVIILAFIHLVNLVEWCGSKRRGHVAESAAFLGHMPVARAVPIRMMPAPINICGVMSSLSQSQPHKIANTGIRKVTVTALDGPTLS